MPPMRSAPRCLRRWLLVLMLSGTTTGCSLVFSHAPPPNRAHLDDFGCTEHNVAAVLDIIWGGLVGYTAIAMTTWPYDEGVDGTVIVGLSWAAVSGLSAAVGISKSRRCRKAMRARGERLGQELSCFEPLEQIEQANGLPTAVPLGGRQGFEHAGHLEPADRLIHSRLGSPGCGCRDWCGDDRVPRQGVDHGPRVARWSTHGRDRPVTCRIV